MSYQRFPIETDPDVLAQDAYELLSSKTGGVWQPSDGNVDTWLIEATARMAAEVRDVAADVPDSIFRTFGTDLVGLPPFEPTSAQAVLGLTLASWSAYVVPAGTTFAVDDLAGDTHAFALQESVTIDELPEESGSRVAQVVALALEPGVAASGIAPRPGNAYLLDAISYVIGVELVEPTSGGSDGESDEAYMDRLAAYLQLVAPRPILPEDFAKLALTIDGVGYAAAINLYNPGPPPETDVERCVTVALADPTGEPCSATVKANVDALLQSLREVNFLVFEIDPGYVVIAVDFVVAIRPGYSPTGVVESCIQALTTYLAPASFAQTEAGEVAGLWIPSAAVYYLDIGLVLQRTDGVDHVVSYTLNGGAADVPLPEPASLPRAGAITGVAQ